MSVCLSVCIPLALTFFGPIGMKRGMEPWTLLVTLGVTWGMLGCASSLGLCTRMKHVMGQRGKHFFFFWFIFLCVSEYFESIETHNYFSKIFVNLALRIKRVNFFSHFYAFQSISSRLRHIFFPKFL